MTISAGWNSPVRPIVISAFGSADDVGAQLTAYPPPFIHITGK